jgi:hypothetical protein
MLKCESHYYKLNAFQYAAAELYATVKAATLTSTTVYDTI